MWSGKRLAAADDDWDFAHARKRRFAVATGTHHQPVAPSLINANVT
jgi:hypothetical protein